MSQADTLAGDGSAFAFSAHASHPDFPIKDWDRYEPLGFLGQGGMGLVFLARDRRLGREVAIKFVRIEGERHLQRFLLEARAQARVDHEHVCKVFEVGEVGGRVFITMQHIPGRSLDALAAELSLEQKVIVVRDAARGVHEAHRVGIIHRDLKPSNIMVERAEDGALRTFVMDFGLAHEWNQDVTETGSVLGTPAFMSPEQARGEVSRLDRRTDVYSLGATLYQVSTGHSPVSGSNALEILSAVTSDEVPSMRTFRMDIPKDLEAITLKCLEKDRSRRYDSAKVLADDLDRFLAGEPVLARPTGLWYRLQRKLQKHKQLAGAGAAALLVVSVSLGMALKTRRDAGRRERLAQEFTESMARIESMARYSALAPLHDIRPDLKAVRDHMARLQEDMRQAGPIANGPGHYALGRGYWTLEDDEKAREHLQMAWDAGYRAPRVAYALAVVLGQQYREKLLEAERIPSADQRSARMQSIDATLRAPALTFLHQAKGADVPSPEYLEALMAFCEGRLDEALERLRALGEELPWFYEAPLLRGSLFQARAWKRWNQGEREAALADFDAGREILAAAATSGRSAPAIYAAMAELELNALIMEKYGQGHVEPAFERGMTAAKLALRAQPDHVPSLILESGLLRHYSDFKSNRSEDAEDLGQQAVMTAWKALEAESTRADAWVALGMAYYQWGNARQDQNRDPTDQLAKGLKAFESLSTEKRDYAVENHIGLIHQTWSDFEGQNGRDPAAHLNGAIAAYEQATRMEPHLLPAWINLGTCLQQRAALPGGAHPEEDLKTALEVLGQAQSLNPKHFVPYYVKARVWYELALRKRQRGEDPGPELRQSLDASRQGLEINRAVPHLHNVVGLAQLLLAQSAWDAGREPSPFLVQAQAAYRQAVAVAPNQVHGHLNLGDLLIWKARWETGAKALQSLREAEAALQKALAIAPGNKTVQANLGRACAVRLELCLRDGAEPASHLQRGEALLAKALAVDAQDRDALQYLGELRVAAAQWKAAHLRAQPRDFRSAAQPLEQALKVAPEATDLELLLARCYLAEARWERLSAPGERLSAAGAERLSTRGERASAQDERPSERSSRARAQALLAHLGTLRPRWGEAMAVQGALQLEEAEGLPTGARSAMAAEAHRVFAEAFGLNGHLLAEWKAQDERAQKLAKTPL
ncbi:protein kinase domain-containing protein [Geothrix limicola]|uniref:protein kinase domain-containing protein n=1 Tax=Geothrix limicola TaxID=2927978 RepID=UPI002552E225|nr:serine/threonine-protein kinase [Geothrix limicola]